MIRATYDDTEAKVLVEVLGRTSREAVMLTIERGGEWVIANSQDKYLNAPQGDTRHLHSVTGRLSSGVHWWHEGDFTVVVGPTNLVYAAIHEFGGVIRPVRAKYLRFKSRAGKYVFMKQVRIPARPYISPSMRELVESGSLEKIGEQVARRFAALAESEADRG